MNLSENAKKFLNRKPTLIQTLQGYKFYECPVYGEDVGFKCITPCGKLYSTGFSDRLDTEDLEYQVNVWRKVKARFKG